MRLGRHRVLFVFSYTLKISRLEGFYLCQGLQNLGRTFLVQFPVDSCRLGLGLAHLGLAPFENDLVPGLGVRKLDAVEGLAGFSVLVLVLAVAGIAFGTFGDFLEGVGSTVFFLFDGLDIDLNPTGGVSDDVRVMEISHSENFSEDFAFLLQVVNSSKI